jgi:hypothetical protein
MEPSRTTFIDSMAEPLRRLMALDLEPVPGSTDVLAVTSVEWRTLCGVQAEESAVRMLALPLGDAR